MKIRRKAKQDVSNEQELAQPAAQAPEASGPGPYDVSEVRDEIERVDLGAVRVAALEGLELRLQVNEATEEVGAVMLAAEDGALELQAFSAPSSGGLWDDVRPQIAADVVRRGGAAEEHESRFGTELHCRVPVDMPDGQKGVQPSRIVGVDGRRWMLRATFLGRPAMEAEGVELWERALELVVVDRGAAAMPVGKQLPLVLPDGARRL